MRVRSLVPSHLYIPFEGPDGSLVTPDALPTVTVTDGAGASVTGATVAVDEVVGIYRVSLPPLTQLDELDVTLTAKVGGVSWSVVETAKVVGARVASPARLREDPILHPLPLRALLRLADAADEWFVEALDYPPVPEGLRARFRLEAPERGPGLFIPGVDYPRAVYTLTVSGSAVDPATISRDSTGALVRDGGQSWSAGIYEVHLAHGRWAGAPEPLQRAAVTFARYLARESKLPERATSVQTEGAYITLAIPGHDSPTGLPDVDAVLTHLRARRYF